MAGAIGEKRLNESVLSERSGGPPAESGKGRGASRAGGVVDGVDRPLGEGNPAPLFVDGPLQALTGLSLGSILLARLPLHGDAGGHRRVPEVHGTLHLGVVFQKNAFVFVGPFLRDLFRDGERASASWL
jgi:hypothetical protein